MLAANDNPRPEPPVLEIIAASLAVWAVLVWGVTKVIGALGA